MAFSQLPRLLLAEDHTASPSPPPFSKYPPALSASFRPSIAVIIGVLTTMFSLTFLLLLYAKHCKRNVNSGYGGTGNFASAAERRNSGVDRSVVESLPVFRFGSLTGHKEGLECAVCLNRFEPADVLRLLPKCKHGFHVECVDIWLEAHSTCPLCRVRVAPEDVLLVLDPKAETETETEPETEPEPEPLADQNKRASKGGEGAAAVSLPLVRRISGRHSSAGEKRTNSVPVVAQRRSEGGDGTLAVSVGCFERVRKDGLLLTESTAAAVEREEFERRFSHRIIVSVGDGTQERWSDLKPSDLLYLRSERIITDSGRISASKVGCKSSGGRGVNNLRSVSEITGVSRFLRRGGADNNEMLGFSPNRTGWWPGNGNP